MANSVKSFYDKQTTNLQIQAQEFARAVTQLKQQQVKLQNITARQRAGAQTLTQVDFD